MQRRLIGVQPGREVEHSEGQMDDLKGVAEVGNWKVPFQSIGEILNVVMNTGELPVIRLITLNCLGYGCVV
jgi:hypothetical protein